MSKKAAITHWPYSANLPQRYSQHYARCLHLKGRAQLDELVKGFVTGGANTGDMARFYFFCLAFEQLAKEGVQGDLAELGVYKGNTATLLAAFARELGRTAYILDTFEGFHSSDLGGVDSGAAATSFRDTSLDAVRALVGDDNVQFVKGYFPDTAAQLPADGRYCLVHIDCDLYAPILRALSYFYPRIAPGGYIIIHDYSSFHWRGAEKAVDEFFADKAESPVALPDGAGSVVIRKAKEARADNWILRKRAALRQDQWAQAGQDGIATDLLGAGWALQERWGVWGVGALHELHLAFLRPVPKEIELEAEVSVFLPNGPKWVDVSMAGRKLARWEFTETHNYGMRSVPRPMPDAGNTAGVYASLSLLLQPHTSERPSDFTPGSLDERPLGVALHRIRYTEPRLG